MTLLGARKIVRFHRLQPCTYRPGPENMPAAARPVAACWPATPEATPTA